MTASFGTRAPGHRGAWAVAGLVFLAAVILQSPLVLNPGYYSHDELQWAAFAEAGTQAPWLGIDAFQYRPLTFNLWMAMSRAWFDTPPLFHGVLVAWGSLNAALLFALGRGFGMRAWPAAIGAVAFALSPYAVRVHGWVGCIADLAWLGCALLLGLILQRTRHRVTAALAATALTGVALLAKEAAFAIPALLAVAWWFDGRRPKWLVALLASGAACALYLALRMDVLLHGARDSDHYTPHLANAPLRWFEYQLFLPIVPLQEAFTVLQRPLPLLVAGVLWIGLFAAVWRASRRLAALFLLAGVAALLPVLPLGSSWNHYAYGFAAVASMTIAAAWPRASRGGRIAIGLFAALSLLHGAHVMSKMQETGRIQAVFSPALARAVQADADGRVALRLAPGAKAWMFQRLTHDIPSYDGVEIGERVRWAGNGEAADHLVLPDGRLQPLP